jgi:DNA-binding response OmpR family regulator
MTRTLGFLVAERLQTEGYKVLEAADGEEAEKMIVAEQPDIVLLRLDAARQARDRKCVPASGSRVLIS